MFIEVRIETTHFIYRKPATIRGRLMLPVNQKLLITTSPSRHNLIIKNFFNNLAGLNLSRKRNCLINYIGILIMTMISMNIFNIKNGTKLQLRGQLEQVLGPNFLNALNGSALQECNLVSAPFGKYSG